MKLHTTACSGIVLRKVFFFGLSLFAMLFAFSRPAKANENSGEEIYKYLSQKVHMGDNSFIGRLNSESRELAWTNAEDLEFQGHLRFLNSPVEGDADQTRLFFIRNAERGRIYILSIPDRDHPDYVALEELIENKLKFNVRILEAEVDGENYQFAQFNTRPVQPMFDKVFRLAIIDHCTAYSGFHGRFSLLDVLGIGNVWTYDVSCRTYCYQSIPEDITGE